MKAIGVTGGIGSGKTTFCRILEARGARVFYSDDEAKRLMVQDLDLRRHIEAEFGTDTYRSDGSLNRTKLASEVFGDAQRLEILNALVHPRVYEAFGRFVDRARRERAPLVVRESAVMPEGPARMGLDAVIAVLAPKEERVRRVVQRDGSLPEEITARMTHQLSEGEFSRLADRIVHNAGSLADLEEVAQSLFDDLTSTGEPYPPLPPNVPGRGNAVMRCIGRLSLGLLGFRFSGTVPNLKKFVLIGAPHTTNWDFVLGMSLLFALGLRVNWIGKHTIFRWPFGRFMRWLGGVPVDRSRTDGLVEQVAEAMLKADRMAIGLAPEGTRKRVDRWKTGFYRIAVAADVPIVIGMLDFANSELRIDSVFKPTGDLEADIATIRARYRGVQGKYPDQFDAA